MEINYNTLIEKIELTRKNNYNCTILLFFAGEVIMEEEEVELSNYFFPLLFYFDTVASDDQLKFEEIINSLHKVNKERTIDSFDVNYILNKNEITTLIDKHKLGYIPTYILVERLKKYFLLNDITELLDIEVV